MTSTATSQHGSDTALATNTVTSTPYLNCTINTIKTPACIIIYSRPGPTLPIPTLIPIPIPGRVVFPMGNTPTTMCRKLTI